MRGRWLAALAYVVASLLGAESAWGASGPAVALSFDEGSCAVAADVSGSANAGSLSGAGWSSAGKFGSAVSLDGVDDRVVVADATSLDFSSAFSISAWVKPQSSSAWAPVAVKAGSPSRAYALFARGGSVGAGMSGEAGSLSLDGSVLASGAWSHVAVTYGGGVLELFVNGVSVGSTFGGGALPITTGELSIGGLAGTGHFHGLIDELRVYSRALSAAEVALDRDAAVGAAYDATAPVVGYAGPLASLDGRTVATDVGVEIAARDGSGAQPQSGVRSIQVLVDGVQKDFVEQPCSAGSCGLDRSWVFVPATYSAGTHEIRVVVADWAGNVTERIFSASAGSGRITSLLEGAQTTRRLPLEATGSGGQTGVKFQYRTDGAGAWSDVPVSTVRMPDGSALSAWPVALMSGKSPALVWDLVGATGEPGMITDGHLPGDGRVQIRGVFSGGSAGQTQDLWATLDRSGASTTNATAPIGPGSVDLVTGNFALAQTDVSIEAYKADLTVTRTHNSRAGGETGPLGRGWSFGIPMQMASADYTGLRNLAEASSGPLPYVLISGTGGEEVLFSESGTGYTPEGGYETLKLTRVLSATVAGKVERFELSDTQAGETMTFTPAGTGGQYKLSGVALTGSANTARYEYSTTPTSFSATESGLVLARMIAPEPAGVDCDAGLVRGCRALEFTYGPVMIGSTGYTRLTSISFTAWDPVTSAMKSTVVSSYQYDADGRLYLWDDPRRGSSHEWQFTYDAAHRLTQLSPALQAPWNFTYQPQTGESAGVADAAGRLRSVRRVPDYNAPQQSVWTVAYGVPVSGTGAPYAMGTADVANWGQSARPTDATAVFRPDDVPSDPPASYAKATVHYLDPLGRETNTALPGGFISTRELDRSGHAVRELSAGNRERALATGTTPAQHAARASELDVKRTYSADGIRLLDEFGPQHAIRLINGTAAQARKHTVYAYDEGAPSTGGPFNLLTTVTVGARVQGAGSDTDTRVGKTEYDWTLRAPTRTIMDPAGLNLRTSTLYDAGTGLAVESRMPRNVNGGDASATRTIYWTAQSNPEDAACATKPDLAGLPCKTKPVAQPGTAGLPNLPTSVTEYGYLLLPTQTTETTGAATRTSTIAYDAAGRVSSRQTTATNGTALGQVTYTYESSSCGALSGQRLYDGSDYYDINITNDYLCRPTRYVSYKTINGNANSIGNGAVTYDELGRIATRSVGPGTTNSSATQTFSYDPVRGLPSQIADSEAGTITATHDADGQLTGETFTSAEVKAETTYDETGAATRRRYLKQGTCTTGCTWLDSQAEATIHDQWLTHTSALSSQRYTYDKAGRLTRVADTPAGQGCVTRSYLYDADSNRTKLTTNPPASGGACSTTTASTVVNYAYDAADRLKSTGYAYDQFGRITSVPASGAGGSVLTNSYYVNDRARTLTQAGRTVTLELDALLRPRARTETNANPETYIYGDLSDKPRLIDQGPDRTYYANGLSGNLDVIVSKPQASQAVKKLQLSNLHGDIVGEATLAPSATAPSATWETDEFGVPRKQNRDPQITQIGAGTSAAATTPTSTLTVTTPTGVQPGDLLLAGIAGSGYATPEPPAGWTSVGGPNYNVYSGGSIYRVFWRVAGASEPATHTFAFNGADKHRGGMLALRNADPDNPINAYSGKDGTSTDPTTYGVQPTVNDTAIVTFAGNNRGDANTGGSWTFPAPLTETWDTSTGTTLTDYNHAAALQLLINGEDTTTTPLTITNATGHPAAPWGTISVAIAPKRPSDQYRYRYLGKHQRAAELPTGVIGMGALTYIPAIGRFTTDDPITGGSVNNYDYGNQDPVNQVDTDGLYPKDRGCDSYKRGNCDYNGNAAVPCAHRNCKKKWSGPSLDLWDATKTVYDGGKTVLNVSSTVFKTISKGGRIAQCATYGGGVGLVFTIATKFNPWGLLAGATVCVAAFAR